MVFFYVSFDLVVFEKVVVFDEIGVLFCEKFLDIFCGFDWYVVV